MKIQLICVGKTERPYLKEGESEYLKRLKHYCNFEKIEIPELKNAKKLREDQIKVEEGKLILAKVDSSAQLILLDENGKSFSSVGFSKYLQKKFNQGGKSLVFVVGGAYGFSDEVYARSNGKISLSEMTFSHQMVRLFFIEQVYRALTILKGEPYHHQ
ncbi:MAG: 23S rRNA (pseudouridine(1915)-N(3))-methyltransferase RlmH [Flavobacteriales bacterium]|nr:23S rRNA (pseudouridine(1915)-N(3))-methyltransferase RlmH [Flavobacteriales bacterium]PIE87486.1 MAG: 23S rRNA (pseudouridine(1915)-N(3))-methyltransferase RlmH [Bacteroidota bacterium]